VKDMYLALGIQEEMGYNWSIGTEDTDPQTVADQLNVASGLCYPDEIFLIRNGIPGPEVIGHWGLRGEYNVR
jgi:hypothetical protein